MKKHKLKMGKNDVIAHNIRFYNPEPRAIHCIALERKRKKLALSRSDNSIEIWDVCSTPVLQKVIFNNLSNSVEDLKWYNDRLFSCGLQGYIVEYDCVKESILDTVSVTGGPAWCIDVNKKKKLLACGTEDGYINIFEVGNEKLEYFKFLDKQQGRILCMCWDKAGQHLVTGSVDVIRVWNVDTGHAIHKMKTGRIHPHKETVVWCVAVTSDFLIISGDSRGYLCFWDGKIGTQVQSNNSHAADILSVALTEDESAVYCAGVDPTIAIYGRVLESSGDRRKWAKGGQRKIHEHDVRALAISADDKLYSGGIDGYLALSSFPPRVLIKFPPFLKGSCVNFVPSKRFMLLRHLTHLELWKLGLPKVSEDSHDSLVKLEENRTQILQIKPKKNSIIIAAAISKDGRYIAYSTENALKFLRLFLENTTNPLTKLSEPSDCGPCKLIEFYKKNEKQFCACATRENEIQIIEIGENVLNVIHTISPLKTKNLEDTISHLIIPSNSPYLVIADCQSNISVWLNSNWDFHCTLPKYQSSVTAISVREGTDFIVVAYSDFKVVEFDLKMKQYTEFSKNLSNNFESFLHTPISSISFDRRRNSSVMFHDDSCIVVIEKNNVSRKSKAKQPRLEKTDEKSKIHKEYSYNVVKKQKHIISVGWLKKGEMAIVSACPLKLAENLPPTLARKLFGT